MPATRASPVRRPTATSARSWPARASCSQPRSLRSSPRTRASASRSPRQSRRSTSPPEGALTMPDPKQFEAQLRGVLDGRVVGPDDPAYDEARAVFFRGFDRRPAAIVGAADATDVARVVSLARDTGRELAVRSGGHSTAGYGTSEGGIVLDLSPMRALDIDAEGRTAWAETGLTAGAYTAA